MSKQFWAVIAVIVVIFIGIFAIGGNKSDKSGGKKADAASLTQHVEGSKSSGVTLVEYGDYQCPYCQQYYPTIKQVQTEFKDQIQFQYRNYPLTNAHPNAFAAARAAEAAGKQNKYWEMHDLLYENNDPTGKSGWVASTDATTYFDSFANQIGLNIAQYHKDFSSIATNDFINADMAEGTRLGIEGTPTFYIDDKAQSVGNSVDSFRKIIKAAIAKKSKSSTPATTTPIDSGTTTQTPATTPTDTTEQTPVQ